MSSFIGPTTLMEATPMQMSGITRPSKSSHPQMGTLFLPIAMKFSDVQVYWINLLFWLSDPLQIFSTNCTSAWTCHDLWGFILTQLRIPGICLQLRLWRWEIPTLGVRRGNWLPWPQAHDKMVACCWRRSRWHHCWIHRSVLPQVEASGSPKEFGDL